MAAAIPDISARSPRFTGLGSLTYKITTASPDAQFFFDQGLKLFYAFNPGEAVASFRAASDADPTCAMCAWGEALTLGPNLNGPMQDENIPLALTAVRKARGLAANATPVERALIDAVAARYSADKDASRGDLDIAYAEAMAKVHAAYGNDMDVATVYAEAAMNVRSEPWRRGWDATGRFPTGFRGDSIAAIEDVLARQPDHPGAIHLYIHALDGSVFPDKVVPYADKLARLMPNAGHMVHMPAHTYYNVGRYKDALATNVAAIAVDDAYLNGPAAATFVYRHGLYQHNVHFAIVAAEMAGDEAAALRLAKLMNDFQGQGLQNRFEVSAAAAIHAVVRFQSPAEMLAVAKPDKKQAYMTGMWHFARGSAYAYQKNTRSALAEAKAIDALRTGRNPQATRFLGDLLGVAAEVVRGRAAASEGKWLEAAAHFGKAVAFQDKVPYRDPPFWDYPVRQAQGVALFRAGKHREAAEMLRQALIEAPSSGYALYALKEVSSAIGDELAAQEYGKLLEKAWSGSQPPDLQRL
jgi:tetratricopeptide (TPR) repeat protein